MGGSGRSIYTVVVERIKGVRPLRLLRPLCTILRSSAPRMASGARITKCALLFTCSKFRSVLAKHALNSRKKGSRPSRRAGTLFWPLAKTGGLGFEPRQTDSESAVLPLHHPPRVDTILNNSRHSDKRPAVISPVRACDSFCKAQ